MVLPCYAAASVCEHGLEPDYALEAVLSEKVQAVGPVRNPEKTLRDELEIAAPIGSCAVWGELAAAGADVGASPGTD